MYPYQNAIPTIPTYSRQEVVRVNGRNGAEAFQMQPNSSVLLMDTTAPIVWLAQTDGAGYKTVTPYKIIPFEPEQPFDVQSLEDRITKLEEAIHAKSDAKSNKRKPSGVDEE